MRGHCLIVVFCTLFVQFFHEKKVCPKLWCRERRLDFVCDSSAWSTENKQQPKDGVFPWRSLTRAGGGDWWEGWLEERHRDFLFPPPTFSEWVVCSSRKQQLHFYSVKTPRTSLEEKRGLFYGDRRIPADSSPAELVLLPGFYTWIHQIPFPASWRWDPAPCRSRLELHSSAVWVFWLGSPPSPHLFWVKPTPGGGGRGGYRSLFLQRWCSLIMEADSSRSKTLQDVGMEFSCMNARKQMYTFSQVKHFLFGRRDENHFWLFLGPFFIKASFFLSLLQPVMELLIASVVPANGDAKLKSSHRIGFPVISATRSLFLQENTVSYLSGPMEKKATGITKINL